MALDAISPQSIQVNQVRTSLENVAPLSAVELSLLFELFPRHGFAEG